MVIASLGHWLTTHPAYADWGVAVGTFALALATVVLAGQTRSETKKVAEQAIANLRAFVYPEGSAEWAQARGEWAGVGNQWALPLRNGGPGLALNVSGTARWPATKTETTLMAGSIAPGARFNARPAAPVTGGWADSVGELRYSDLNGDKWVTRFKLKLGDGNQLYAEHEPPELATP